jgi:hypothetical protein
MSTNSDTPETPGEFSTKLAQSLQTALVGTVEPARQALEEIEQAIEVRERELGELRQLRTNAKRLVAFVDPDVVIRGRPKTPRSHKPHTLKAGEETVDKVEAWLRENVTDGRTFSTPELVKEEGFDLISPSMLNAALHQLADRGTVRLDSVGGPGGYRRKNYKLVGK